MMKKIFYVAMVVIAVFVVLGVSSPGIPLENPPQRSLWMPLTIAGVVTSFERPESGVWVIAETKDLGTGYRKIVVTDDQGRYLLSRPPESELYRVVRGYGLVDSAKVQATPGKPLDLKAVIAPSPKEAAQYYPAAYWYSLLHIPPKSDFPGTGPNGNGISERIRTRASGLN